MTRARKLTAATARRAETQFRQYVMALPPDSHIDWHDMDSWIVAKVGAFDDDAQEDLTVECMVVCEKLEEAGWLVRIRGGDWPDNYLRTDKTLQPWE